MTLAPAPRRVGVGLCLLVCGLLVLLAVRHARAIESLVPMSFGMETPDVLVFALLAALLSGASALLARAHRQPLSPRTTRALGGAAVLLVVAAVAAGNPHAMYDGGFGGAYSSQLFLDFSPTVPWLVGVVVVAALGLLPVAALAGVSASAARVRPSRRTRLGAVCVCAVAALLLLGALEREVALLTLLGGDPQELTSADAVVWVAALWALVAAVASARALRRARREAPRLALLMPPALLLGAVLLLLGQGGRHECCFAYATEQVSPEAVVELGSGIGSVQDWYRAPPVADDLVLLGGCLFVGVGLPLGLQLLRVRTRASTPPG